MRFGGLQTTLRKKHHAGEGRGYRASDDAVRYARPDYIKSLAGTSKSASSYCYAGFEQLVHVSSGVVRYFLEPAAKMYSEATTKGDGKPVSSIPPGIQNSVLREMAKAFLFDELDKESQDKSGEAPPAEDLAKLANLIEALGGLFHQCILSDRAERRVFSIAFSDTPSQEISRYTEAWRSLRVLSAINDREEGQQERGENAPIHT